MSLDSNFDSGRHPSDHMSAYRTQCGDGKVLPRTCGLPVTHEFSSRLGGEITAVGLDSINACALALDIEVATGPSIAGTGREAKTKIRWTDGEHELKPADDDKKRSASASHTGANRQEQRDCCQLFHRHVA